MPTLTIEQLVQMAWGECQANVARVDSCKKHFFPNVEVVFNGKATCSKCGGEMPLLEIRHYILGYIAAGGDPKDILESW